jgi:hypothetical protein
MSQYWFRPKTYGYGATPTNLKGWAAVAIYATAILALTLPLMAWPVDMPASPKIWQLLTWAIMTAMVTMAFVRFTRAKTDGQWAWRWGK